MLPNQTIDRRYLLRKYGESKIFLVADLHLGFDIGISKRFDTRDPQWSFEIINKLKMDLKKTKPDYLIILGDLEHTIDRSTTSQNESEKQLTRYSDSKEKIYSLFQKQIVDIDALDIILIKGEHDIAIGDYLGDSVVKYPSSGTSLLENQLGVLHGNVKPEESLLLSTEIFLGHIHPTIEFKDELNISHKLPVFAKIEFLREELFKLLGFDIDLDDLFDFSLIDLVPITLMPTYNDHLHITNSLILNNPRGIQKKTKHYPELRNILKNSKLTVKMTDGIEIGFLEDLI
jgi:metallophosphoesterase superfamily enzyme